MGIELHDEIDAKSLARRDLLVGSMAGFASKYGEEIARNNTEMALDLSRLLILASQIMKQPPLGIQSATAEMVHEIEHEVEAQLEEKHKEFLNEVTPEQRKVFDEAAESIPYVSFTNEELEAKPPIGDDIECPNCDATHEVMTQEGAGIQIHTYSCGEQVFLGGINGKRTAPERSNT